MKKPLHEVLDFIKEDQDKETKLEELFFDSVTLIETLMILEDTYGVSLELADLQGMTIRDLEEKVQGKP